MTYEEKREAFRNGEYSCEIPPVVHGNWTTDDWIQFIDTNGTWNKENSK